MRICWKCIFIHSVWNTNVLSLFRSFAHTFQSFVSFGMATYRFSFDFRSMSFFFLGYRSHSVLSNGELQMEKARISLYCIYIYLCVVASLMPRFHTVTVSEANCFTKCSTNEYETLLVLHFDGFFFFPLYNQMCNIYVLYTHS